MDDRGVSKALVAGLASAAALAAGLWLFEQLRDPISDLRLHLSVLRDRVKGETS